MLTNRDVERMKDERISPIILKNMDLFMKIYHALVLGTMGIATSANAQSISIPDVEGQLSDLFLKFGIGEFTIEKYFLLVAIGLLSMFAIPFVLAKCNGAESRQAAFLGLQGLYGGVLFAGFITAPLGLILLGRAIFKAIDTSSFKAATS